MYKLCLNTRDELLIINLEKLLIFKQMAIILI